MTSTASLRKTGIGSLADLPWGAHICLFYETPRDLIEAIAGYFTAGLADGELCLWALPDALSREEATRALSELIPSFPHHLAAGHVELIPGYEWYLEADELDAQRVLRKWQKKQARALATGFSGVRASGNAFWNESRVWKAFRDYEDELDRSLEGSKLIALCTYSLHSSCPNDLLDVAACHRYSIARRAGRWEFLEVPQLAASDTGIGATDALSRCFPGHDRLTPREHDVLAQIVKGDSSKEAARVLGISPRTLEFHRGNLMRKLRARNVAELVSKVAVRPPLGQRGDTTFGAVGEE